LRSVAFACAVVLPVVLGLGLLVFYIDGQIGMATTLVAGFSIAAVSFTAVVFRERAAGDDATDAGPLVLDGRVYGQNGIASGIEMPTYDGGQTFSDSLRVR
jgi:hypothetical protein